MAIDPEEIDLIQYPQLPNSAINMNNTVAQADEIGLVSTFKIKELTNYLIPRVASGRSSSYVPITGFDLPRPTSNNAYSWIKSGDYYLDGELEFTAVGVFNQIYWDGLTWEVVQVVNINPPSFSNEGFDI